MVPPCPTLTVPVGTSCLAPPAPAPKPGTRKGPAHPCTARAGEYHPEKRRQTKKHVSAGAELEIPSQVLVDFSSSQGITPAPSTTSCPCYSRDNRALQYHYHHYKSVNTVKLTISMFLAQITVSHPNSLTQNDKHDKAHDNQPVRTKNLPSTPRSASLPNEEGEAGR